VKHLFRRQRHGRVRFAVVSGVFIANAVLSPISVSESHASTHSGSLVSGTTSGRVRPLSSRSNLKPSRPRAVTGSGDNGQIVVTWSRSSNSGTAQITEYKAQSFPGGHSCVAVRALKCAISGLEDQKTYSVVVRAKGRYGWSLPSTPVRVFVMAAPTAPVNVNAIPRDGAAQISWSVPSNGGSPITKYLVVDPQGQSCTSSKATTCIVDGLTNGDNYYFTVRATNRFGVSAPSGASNEVTPNAGPSISGPVQVSAVSSTSAVISWSGVNGYGSPVSSYTVSGVPQCTFVSSTSCRATGLSPMGQYSVCVRAQSVVNLGPPACSLSFQELPINSGSQLNFGGQLGVNNGLFSPNNQFFAVLQTDGNLVVYQYESNGRPVVHWSLGAHSTATLLKMQTDGNLVLYTSSLVALWSSSTDPSSHDYLIMQSDGNLVIYSSVGLPLWSELGRTGYSGSTLPSGWTIRPGQALYSSNGNFLATLQSSDGNFVVYQTNGPATWSSNRGGGAVVIMQSDGNLVEYSASQAALWSSGTNGTSNDTLIMQTDGNLVVYAGCGPALWSSQGGPTGASCGGGSSGNTGQTITNEATKWINQVPYCWDGGDVSGPTHGSGSTTQSAEGAVNCLNAGTVGFDCTGLTLFAVYQALGISLPHDGSQAAFALSHGGQLISSEANLQVGDLVFFGGTFNSFDHSGIYVGNNTIVDANVSYSVGGGATRPDGVHEEPLNWQLPFVGAVRM